MCRGEWLAISGADGDRLVIYLHGGGYCIGSPRSHRNIAADIRWTGLPGVAA